MIKKIIFIFMALTIIILLVNRIEPSVPVEQNFDNMIGCHDYTYKFNINVPATVVFTVTKDNGIDEMGFFKSDNVEGNSSTILHCGNNYHVVYSSPGYKDYEEDMIVKGFKPIFEPRKEIILERL